MNKDKFTRAGLEPDVPGLYQLSYLALYWRSPYFVNIFVRGASQKSYNQICDSTKWQTVLRWLYLQWQLVEPPSYHVYINRIHEMLQNCISSLRAHIQNNKYTTVHQIAVCWCNLAHPLSCV